jgi:hypothetical protein
MRWKQTVGAAFSVIVSFGVSACVQISKSNSTQSFDPCDVINGTATSYGRTASLRYAEANFKNQIPDARGELLNIGLRRVRVGPKRVSCRPYALFGGNSSWTTCTVQARVCGR